MPDAWDRERPQPVAVGPPRRRLSRADRIREARRRRRRRVVRAVTLCVFVVIVIGAVFLGSRLWHSVFGGGSDYSGEGKTDIVIQVHDLHQWTAQRARALCFQHAGEQVQFAAFRHDDVPP